MRELPENFVDRPTWPFALREWPGLARLKDRDFWLGELRCLGSQTLVILAAGLLLAKLGPYGTYRDLAPLERYPYWLLLVAMAWTQIGLLDRALAAFWRGGQAIRGAVAGMLAALPITAEVYWVDERFRAPLQWSDAGFVYGNTAVIAVAMAVLVALLRQTWEAHAWEAHAKRPTPAIPAPPAPSRFFQRIPPNLGRNLLALETEDHYLRIHTDKGSALILLRLKDALEELQAADGRQVHRSWWVARQAILGRARDGERVRLTLSNGLIVPVSRRFRPGLREAGWLD